EHEKDGPKPEVAMDFSQKGITVIRVRCLSCQHTEPLPRPLPAQERAQCPTEVQQQPLVAVCVGVVNVDGRGETVTAHRASQVRESPGKRIAQEEHPTVNHRLTEESRPEGEALTAIIAAM